MRIAGLALIVVALLGFGFVADDLDHLGELFGTAVILLAGIGTLAASFITSRTTKEMSLMRKVEALSSEEVASFRKWFDERERAS